MALQTLDVLTVSLNLGLISVDLLLLLVAGDLMTLQLVADQRTGAKSQRAADEGAGRRMVDCGTDNTAGRSAAKSANARALFPGAERATGATRQ